MRRALAPSAIRKHSIEIGGCETSISLEPPFWDGLRRLAQQRGVTLSDLVHAIDQQRTTNNLASAVRCAVLEFYAHAMERRERDRTQQVGQHAEEKAPMEPRRERHVEKR
jgi:predicted DNA-binding ribbon-helix-helix protein